MRVLLAGKEKRTKARGVTHKLPDKKLAYVTLVRSCHFGTWLSSSPSHVSCAAQAGDATFAFPENLVKPLTTKPAPAAKPEAGAA